MIEKMNVNSEGRKVSAGAWAVDPAGNICLLRVGAPLKDGWKYATDADIKKSEDAEKARQKKA